jgi:hypothetical protein
MKLEKMTPKYGMICVMAILMFLFSLSCVKALGVTRPVPYDIELMRGESARFTFQIQAVTSTDKTACSYSISSMEPLTIEFDENEVTVDAGSIKNVYGTVSVPADTPYKTYSGQLSVSCGAAIEGGVSGSAVKTTIGSSPFTVNVVELRTTEIKEVGGPEVQKIPYFEITIIAAVLILLISVYYYFRIRKKQ